MKLNQTLKDCIFKVKHYSKQIAIYLPLRVSLRNAVEYHRPWMSILRPGPRTGLKSRAEAVVAELPAARLNKAADPVEEKIGETLGCFSFPESRWRKVRTNNPLERLMKEIRRRSRVAGAFPDGQSCLCLAAARLKHVAGTQWSTRKHMNMEPLREMKLLRNGAAAA